MNTFWVVLYIVTILAVIVFLLYEVRIHGDNR